MQTTRTQIIEQTWTWDKLWRKKILNSIELVSRAEALIPDDVILIRSGSLGTGHRVSNLREWREREKEKWRSKISFINPSNSDLQGVYRQFC